MPSSAWSEPATCFPALVLALSLAGCSSAEPAPAAEPRDDEAELRALLALPTRFALPAIPAYNALTSEKIELGRFLFYDERLSANQTQSCGTCHLQRLAFSDGKRAPEGSTGQQLRRNSPGLANVAYFASLTWANPNLRTLEEQLLVPIRGDNPVELGVSDGARDAVLARFDADPDYRERFARAFPESNRGATVDKIVFALASFCRTMVSGNSPYDLYRAGNKNALSESQRRGLVLFNGERLECFHCHSGTNGTVSYLDASTTEETAHYPFFNDGLYNIDGEGAYPTGDQGLYEVTLDPRDRGLYRPPSLRNVALTAPYMHDGSIPDLRGVIAHYAAGGTVIEYGAFAGDGRTSPLKSGLIRGFTLTDDEMEDVLAFLDALTDPDFLENPALSDPSAGQ